MSRFSTTTMIGTVGAAAFLGALVAPPAVASDASTGQPRLHRCGDAGLRTSFSRFDGAAGSLYTHIRWRNVSGRTCVVRGFPKVVMAKRHGHKAIGAYARRSGALRHRVKVRPGKFVSARLQITDARLYGPRCHRVKIRGYRIYAPHNGGWDFVKHRGVACANTKVKLMRVRSAR